MNVNESAFFDKYLSWNKNDLIRTILEQHQDINKLKDKVISSEKEINDLRIKIATVNKFEDSKKLNEVILTLQNEKARIEGEFTAIKNTMQNEIDHLNSKLEESYSKNNYEIQMMSSKIESINVLERVNHAQDKEIKNLEMENEMNSKLFSEIMRKKGLENDMKITNLKKKMMSQIENSQKYMAEVNSAQMNANTKLMIMQVNQLILEIEYQTVQFEKVLRRNFELEKKIFQLEKDTQIHHQIECVIKAKNMKLEQLLAKELKEKHAKDDKLKTEDNFTKNRLRTNSNDFSRHLLSPIKDENGFLFEKKIFYLEKKLSESKQEYEILRVNFEGLKEKIEEYEKKTRKVFLLIKFGIQKISEDTDFKSKKELVENLEKIQNLDFTNLSPENKYTFLMILLKHISPFVKVDEINDVENKSNYLKFMNKSKNHFRNKSNSNKGINSGMKSFSVNSNEQNSALIKEKLSLLKNIKLLRK